MNQTQASAQGQLEHVSQTHTGRVRELAPCHVKPMLALLDEVATLAAGVDVHLRKMGAVWK